MIKEYVLLKETDIKLIEDKIGIEKLEKEELNQYLYCKGYYDKEFFGMYFFENIIYNNYGKHQKEILKKINEKNKLNIIIARGHGKTTTLLIDLLHSLLYKSYKSQIYVAQEGLGIETLGKIKVELETNIGILEVFGDLIPKMDRETVKEHGKKKWRQKMLELLNGEVLETLTPGQSVRGKRPKRIIVDDINKKAPGAKEAEGMMEWFFSSLYNTLLPGGIIITIGTIVGNLCLVKQLKDEKWETVEYKAIENGKPLWEDMWSLESLEERKKDIGTLRFNQEYMNIPINSEDTIIKECDIRFFDYNNFNKKFDYILMGIDPAISEKETSDEFGITITGHIGKDKYVIENVGLKGKEKSLKNIKEKIEYYYDKYKVNKIIVETNAFQKIMKDIITELRMAADGVNSHKDKITRVLEWQGDFEDGHVFFNRQKTNGLLDQLLAFPDVDHDDKVDSMIFSFGNKKQKQKQKRRIIMI